MREVWKNIMHEALFGDFCRGRCGILKNILECDKYLTKCIGWAWSGGNCLRNVEGGCKYVKCVQCLGNVVTGKCRTLKYVRIRDARSQDVLNFVNILKWEWFDSVKQCGKMMEIYPNVSKGFMEMDHVEMWEKLEFGQLVKMTPQMAWRLSIFWKWEAFELVGKCRRSKKWQI